MKRLLFWVCCGCFFLAQAGEKPLAQEFEKLPWLIRVESTYTDSLNAKDKYFFSGYGFLIKALDRYFIVTASHLSQGGVLVDKATLKLSFWDVSSQKMKVVPYLKRVANNKRDVEVIEVSKKDINADEALATWVAVEDLSAQDAPYFPLGRFLLNPKWSKLFIDQTNNPFSSAAILGDFTSMGLDVFVPTSSLLKIPFVSPLYGYSIQEILALSQKNNSYYFHKKLLTGGLDATDGEIVSMAATHFGMSGLPLIVRAKTGVFVDGMSVSGARAFESSWFSPAFYLSHTLLALLNLEFNVNLDLSKDNFRFDKDLYWKCREGLLYREGSISNISDRNGVKHTVFLQEAVFASSKRTGDGSRGDNGDGTRGDHGDGSRGDGGGSLTPTKIPKLLEGTYFSIDKMYEKPALAFDYRWNGKRYLIPAEMDAMSWLIDNLKNRVSSSEDIKVIHDEDELLLLIWNRMKSFFEASSNAKEIQSTIQLEQLSPISQYQQKAVQFVMSEQKDESTKKVAYHVSLNWGDDSLDFDLKHYEKEIVVISKKKRSYRIELSSFLMTSPSHYNFSFEKFSYLFSPEFKRDFPNRELSFKIKNEDVEYVLWK